MYPVMLSMGDVFTGLNNRTVPCADASPTSNRLLENLNYFTEKTRNVKGDFNVKLERQNLVQVMAS